jgi:tetratricopeptide (TPR) repeat protein
MLGLRAGSRRIRGWMAAGLAGLSLLAADGPDRVAFDAALRSFSIGAYARAAEEFSAFASQFPESPLKAEAVRRTLYSQAEAEVARGDFAAAQKTFARYLSQFPGSDLSLRASVRRSEALLRSGQPGEAAAVLDQSDGAFARALTEKRPADLLLAGSMIAAQSHLAAGDPVRARAAVVSAVPFAATPAEQWDRLRLEVRILEAARQIDPAIEASERLRAIARADGLAPRRPESAALLGRLLMSAGRGEPAVAALEENLAPSVPATFRADAVGRLADWWVSQGRLAQARERLEAVASGLGADPSVAALRLRLGQIHLREHLARRGTQRIAPATAESAVSLTRAVAELERTAASNPPAEVRGPLTLSLAWCRWEEALAGESRAVMTQALAGFRAAAELLPATSGDGLVARYKAADASSWLGDSSSALRGYLEVADAVADRPAERDAWMPAALEQAVIAAIAGTNAPAGESVLRRLLDLPQAAERAGRGALWLGSALAQRGAGELGRGLLQDYLKRFPESGLRPEVELELAMLGLHDGNWSDSVAELRRWLAAHPGHPGAVRAGFHLAYALSRSGDPAAAMRLFSELAAKNPTDPGTISAQLWLAGRFFEQQDYLQAGQASAALLTNATVRAARGDTWYRARLWAAEAGRKLQNFDSAADHYRELINDKAAPGEVQSAALFHYGELLQAKPVDAGGDPLSRYRLALEAFTRVLEFTNSPYVAPALGMMANCHFQLSTLNPADYARAADLYLRAAKDPAAGIETRCRAWLGYAAVNRRMAELRTGVEAGEFVERAIRAGLDVALGRVLLPGERVSPEILAEAARSTGETLERLGRTGEAAGLYEHVARELPAVAATWGQRARRIRESLLEKPR